MWSVIVRSWFAIMWLVGISYFQGSLGLACWKINWFLSFLKNNIILYWFLGIFPSCTPVPLTSSSSISAPHHRSIPPLRENPPKVNFKKRKETKPTLLLFFSPSLQHLFIHHSNIGRCGVWHIIPFLSSQSRPQMLIVISHLFDSKTLAHHHHWTLTKTPPFLVSYCFPKSQRSWTYCSAGSTLHVPANYRWYRC